MCKVVFFVVQLQAQIHNVVKITNLVQILPDLTKRLPGRPTYQVRGRGWLNHSHAQTLP